MEIGSNKMSDRREQREMHKATCGDCGKECEVPFEPKQDRPVYCTDCFQKHRPQNRGRSGGRGGSRFGGRGGSGFNRRPREMHKATCGDCGKECEVPFEPRQDKPVYCNECFQNHRPSR